MSYNSVGSKLGMTGMGLKHCIPDLNKLCSELGFPKLNNKGSRDLGKNLEVSSSLIHQYKEEILAKSSIVYLSDFAKRHGYTANGLIHLGVNPYMLHEECGITYNKNVKYLPSHDQILEELKYYISAKNRYVSSMEFSSHSGYSKSSIYAAVGSVEQINRELGYFQNNLGFEEYIHSLLKELFPDELICRQKSFPGLKYKRSLRYDFYLPGLNLLVEADGPQHFDESSGNFSREILIRDTIKNEYAQKEGIHLVRVRWSLNFRKTDVLEYFKPYTEITSLPQSFYRPKFTPLHFSRIETSL